MKRRFTVAEDRELRLRRKRGDTMEAIAQALGRKWRSVQNRLTRLGITKDGHKPPAQERHPHVKGPDVTPEQIEECKRLSEARDRRNFTQVFFGDPPPGYSARDGKVGMRA